MFGFLRRLFGKQQPSHRGVQVRDTTKVVQMVLDGGLRRLSDAELDAFVGALLRDARARAAMQGNRRFLESVHARFARKPTLTAKQRRALYNILERAMPHNLVAGLLRARETP